MKTANIALLNTGDELLQGEILNRNAQSIALLLQEHGFYLNLIMTCGDAESEILSAIQHSLTLCDVLIITGGLGPTEDDRTRFALAKYLQSPLEFHEPSWNLIEQRASRLKIVLQDNSRQQALFPHGSEVLPNPFGSAPGCAATQGNDQLIFMLPGPPRECMPMMQEEVMPRLLKVVPSTGKSLLKWRVFGIAEGVIAHQLQTALHHKIELAYRWHFPYVDIKWMYTQAEYQPEIPALIESVIAPYRFPRIDKIASEALREWFTEHPVTVAIADSATGGLLQSLLQTPETCERVRFGTDAPEGALMVQLTGLERYWAGEAGDAHTLTLSCIRPSHPVWERQVSFHTLTGAERQYAAEWAAITLLNFFSE